MTLIFLIPNTDDDTDGVNNDGSRFIDNNSNDNDCHGDKDDSNDIDFSNDGSVFGCCGDKNDVDVDADIVDDWTEDDGNDNHEGILCTAKQNFLYPGFERCNIYSHYCFVESNRTEAPLRLYKCKWAFILQETIEFFKIPLFFWRTKPVNQKWKRGFSVMGRIYLFSNNKITSLITYSVKMIQSKKILKKEKYTVT